MIEKKDIQEVGDAVERVGQELDKQLNRVWEKLSSLSQLVTEIDFHLKSFKQEITLLKKEWSEAEEAIEGWENKVDKIESRFTALIKNFEKTDVREMDIRADQNLIKKELENLKSGLKELLGHTFYVTKKLQDLDRTTLPAEKQKPE